MSENVKKRYWGAVLYPESLPENWKEILKQTYLPIAISPLHDKDINESVGELKKPHYHIILCYGGPTTFNSVKKITDKLNAPIPIGIENVRRAYEYFTHKNDADKYQYDHSEIERLNGFNILDYAELSVYEKCELRKEATKLIRDNDILEYCDLVDLCEKMDRNDLFDIVSTSTIYFDSVIRSRRNKRKDKVKEASAAMYQLCKEYSEGIVRSETEKKLLDIFGEFEEVDQAE